MYEDDDDITFPEIDHLIDKYGMNITLAKIRHHLVQKYPYVCPNCYGTGASSTYIDMSDGIDGDYEIYSEPCPLCLGIGHTKDRYVQYGEDKTEDNRIVRLFKKI